MSKPLLAAAALVAWPAAAHAHLALMSPVPRHADQKYGPCGRTGSTRTSYVTTYEAGQTITVTWQETVPHPGHFRIAFDEDGDDGFVDPASYTETYSNAAVLLDDIADKAGTEVYSVQVTLPNVTCDRCTLQVIQVMTDKPPYVPGTNDLYYQCADLILVPDDGIPNPPPTTDPGGCRCVREPAREASRGPGPSGHPAAPPGDGSRLVSRSAGARASWALIAAGLAIAVLRRVRWDRR